MPSLEDRERPAPVKKQLPVSLTERDYDRVRALATWRRVSMAHVVRDALRCGLPLVEDAYAAELSALAAPAPAPR